MSKMRLQLTWYNKDMALIPTESDRYEYRWVNPADPRYCETHMGNMYSDLRWGIKPDYSSHDIC